jgi:hypothetical protein
MQQKTNRPVQFELLPDIRASLPAWLERRGGTVDDYVSPAGSTLIVTSARARMPDSSMIG